MGDTNASSFLQSPLLQRVAGAATVLATQAQDVVVAQWQEFEEEAAKTDVWRAEQRLAQEKLATLSNSDDIFQDGNPPRKLEFVIEDQVGDTATTPQILSEEPYHKESPDEDVAEAEQPWSQRIQALLTIFAHEQNARLADTEEVPPLMPRSQLVVQLEALREEISSAVSETKAKNHAKQRAAHMHALQQQAESLSVALAKSQLDSRQKEERYKRIIEDLKSRTEAAEAETLDRMRIVAESVKAESDAQSRVSEMEEELATLRDKTEARIGEMAAGSKALEDEIARLHELDELNRSKVSAMEASLSAADADHNRTARAARNEAEKQQHEMAYARALVLRYLELEGQHEALFPAIAAAFKFTEQEVQRIQVAQEAHQKEISLWGRTARWGSRLADAAREVAQEARRT